MATWASRELARAHWSDAVSIADTALDRLLAAAQEQCEAYAPARPDGELPEDVPVRLALAVVYQAREVYAASQRGEGDVIGVGDYPIRARPLTAPVKALLRPQRRRPAVG